MRIGNLGFVRRVRATRFGSQTYLPEALALFAQMTVQPTEARKGIINTFISGLMSNGLWPTIGSLHVCAAHDEQAGRVNWVSPTTLLLANSGTAATFQTDRGFTGDGTTSFLDYGVGFASIPIISLNSHTMLFRSLTDKNAADRDMGSMTATNTFLIGRNTNSLQTRANSGTTDTNAVADSLGLYGFARSGASAYDMVKNGSVLSSKTTASSAFGTGNVCLLRAGAVYSTRQCGSAVNASYWNATQQANYNTLERAYMTAVGVP